ncbi:MAG: potassium-transporting ATPase subunit KdpA, partial [Spirochaetes bacterium]|nr:potassium-transporting ATPase subunit KdpA [Candidatus Ornithospirochaeta stercoripullorum]
DIDWKNAFFQSVTTRTAGYFSYDQSILPPAGVVLTIILMFIGASPGSTGGGVKTTSFFTAVKASFSLLLGRNPTAFKREISGESVMKAFFVIIISVLLVAAATTLISITDPEFTSDKILYEVVSAYATVGLTMGITPSISTPGKLILIIMMFLGRVGFMTIITSFARRRQTGARYIEEKVIIG